MKKIIFDLDNTLLFIDNTWFLAYQEFIDKYNLDITPGVLYDCIGKLEEDNPNCVITKEFFINYLNDFLSINIDIDALDVFLDLYANIDLVNVDVIREVLSYLSTKYELYSYSNWFSFNQLKRLKRYRLDKYFTKVYGWDIIPSKPSIKGLNIIVGNNKDDFIFIGDSITYDLEVPDKIGIDTIFYNRKNISQNKYREIFNIEELKNIL